MRRAIETVFVEQCAPALGLGNAIGFIQNKGRNFVHTAVTKKGKRFAAVLPSG